MDSLTWAYLQEKLTTTRHGPAQEVWHFPVFLNTIQSLFAALVGSLYLVLSTPRGRSIPAIIPSARILAPLALVAVTSSLASPFGYASLAHIDYITFLLAKSCKLLPVMFLHITVFRKRYPLYKYLVVAAVTAGVAVFTLHSGSKKKKASKLGDDANVAWGMLLLGINLLFDGLTNSTQDYIFSSFQPYTGPQMMCANNMMSSLVTGAYLLVGPAVLAATLKHQGIDLPCFSVGFAANDRVHGIAVVDMDPGRRGFGDKLLAIELAVAPLGQRHGPPRDQDVPPQSLRLLPVGGSEEGVDGHADELFRRKGYKDHLRRQAADRDAVDLLRDFHGPAAGIATKETVAAGSCAGSVCAAHPARRHRHSSRAKSRIRFIAFLQNKTGGCLRKRKAVHHRRNLREKSA